MGLSGGKKFCLGVILLGALALIAGSAAPYWVKKLSGSGSRYGYGLWFYCLDNHCAAYSWTDASPDVFSTWFYVVHATAGLATLFCIIVVFLSLGKLCGKTDSATSAGVWALLGSLLGITAAVVFYLKQEQSLALPLSGYDWDWAFIVFSAGTGLLALFSVVLLLLPNSNNAVGTY